MRRVLPMLLALALPALADMPRVGILATSSCDRDQGFYRAMRDLGYVEGRTIAYDCVIIGDRIGELPKIVNEMVARKPTLITASASPAIRAAQEATRAVPIVMGMSADAVREGFVRSLSHPEANTTGLTGMSMDLLAKRLEAARELLPQASRLAVLTRRAGLREAFMAAFTADMAIVAPRMGFVVKYYGVDDATEARALLPRIVADADLLYLTESPIFQAHAKEMADAIAANRIPAIAGGTLLGIAGVAIVSVGTNAAEVGAQVARYADRIIRGAKPGDLPVEQITKVDLILNAKAARAVGLTIPPSLLMRADRVVE